MSIDRRKFLAGGSTAVAALLASAGSRAASVPNAGAVASAQIAGASSMARGALPKRPVARVEVVKDTYFGETISDPYRWMENYQDRDWLPFLKGQNDYTRAVLDALPRRRALLARIEQLSGDTVETGTVVRIGALVFYTQRPAGANNYKLFVRELTPGAQDSAPLVLVDPTTMSGASGHMSLDWWKASPDGRHVVYGLSKDGSEDSVLHVLRVADGAVLPEQIVNTESADPSWLDDGSGFFYNQLTNPVGSPERYLDSVAKLHRLGSDPAADALLVKRGLIAGLEYDRIQSPHIRTFKGSTIAVLELADVRSEHRFLVAPLADAIAGTARWAPLAEFDDEVTDIDIDGDDIYLLANKGTPRGRVLKTSGAAPAIGSAREVVPQSALVIDHLVRADDGLYLVTLDGGISGLRRLGPDGRVVDIAMPFDGTIRFVSAKHGESGVWISLSGWLQSTALWSVDATGRMSDLNFAPKPAIDVSAYETKRIFATAKDGTKIPYTLIYRKGVKLDGGNPTWIEAYGSYGLAAYTPSFLGRTLALVDAGAIVGYAYVRGGGEYGREWHKAGQLENKPNTWRDLIAVCEDICARKYSSPQHLAIGGRSAGGITVGRAMTERPDLFAAVIDGVGWSNPLRYVVEQDSFAEEPEWGKIDELAGYRALKSIDSYHSVKDGARYPAVLLTTGVTDPRVAPFHVAKMAARLQAASRSGKPILLRVDFDAGHGMGSTRDQQNAEAADTYAFLLQETRGRLR